jgi:hypothetical protein
VSREQINLRERRVFEMKTTWRTLAVVLLVVFGGVGFASLRGTSNSPVATTAAMLNTTMVSMQSDMHSCQNCSSDDHSKCVLGGCTGSEVGMAMESDAGSCQECSSGDHFQCKMDRCTPNESAMAISTAPAMTRDGMVKPSMIEGTMTETKMANAMSPSMTDMKTTDKEMAPKMDAGTMVESMMQADQKK